jgi:hypothetical protein
MSASDTGEGGAVTAAAGNIDGMSTGVVVAAHVGNHNVRNMGSAAGLIGRVTDRLGVVAVIGVGVAGVLG